MILGLAAGRADFTFVGSGVSSKVASRTFGTLRLTLVTLEASRSAVCAIGGSWAKRAVLRAKKLSKTSHSCRLQLKRGLFW